MNNASYNNFANDVSKEWLCGCADCNIFILPDVLLESKIETLLEKVLLVT